MIFEPLCPYLKRKYIIPSYLSVLKLQNFYSQCSSQAFFRIIEEKLFWIMEVINETSATNSIMNLIHTVYVITGAKVLCSILYGSGNISKKLLGSSGTPLPLPISYIKLAKTSLSGGLNEQLKMSS